MHIYIQQVPDYLDQHRVGQKADSVESLLEMLRDIYFSHNHLSSDSIRDKFRILRQQFSRLSSQEYDRVFALVCDLCLEQEVLAFSQGVLAGMNLMTEGNRLP